MIIVLQKIQEKSRKKEFSLGVYQITLSTGGGKGSFFSCFVLRDNNSIVGVEHDLFHRVLIVTICHRNDKWLFLLQLKKLIFKVAKIGYVTFIYFKMFFKAVTKLGIV